MGCLTWIRREIELGLGLGLPGADITKGRGRLIRGNTVAVLACLSFAAIVPLPVVLGADEKAPSSNAPKPNPAGDFCPSAGSCFEEHFTPGCSDAACCELVCASDEFCCESFWDENCADLAAQLCDIGGLLNDDCADAVVISNGFTGFDTSTATTDGPPHALCQNAGDAQVGADIWYNYTSTCTGNLMISLCGSGYDTKMALYAGHSCLGDLVACNDDFCNLRSQITVPVFVGQAYKVRVGGYFSATGAGGINVTCNAGAPPNNICSNSVAILDGDTAFSTIGATTDGPANALCLHAGLDQITRDIWYNYTAQCTGTLAVSLCGSDYDTRMAMYSGTACVGAILACNDDSCQFQSQLSVPVTAGQIYKLRVGGYDNEVGSGTILITPPDCSCDPAAIGAAVPPSGTIDARQPTPLTGSPLQGIGSADEPIQLTLSPAVTGADNCFTLCETNTGGLAPNSISSVTNLGGGAYSIVLSRAITPGAATTIEYAGGGFVTYISHPANVNGDDLSNPLDILRLVDSINNVYTPPHGNYGKDIDRSGAAGPSDILRVVDLLNGADAFVVWNNTMLPSSVGCP